MQKHLLLVDHENVHSLNLSVLDESFRAIVFVGALQNPPKASRQSASAHRFTRVEFRKVLGSGGNALDFHIACELGRVYETARDTVCIVLSRDKGFDPLLLHLNSVGLKCRRVDDMDSLATEVTAAQASTGLDAACPHCKGNNTIEHLGGRWCSTCGRFAEEPDSSMLPSSQPQYRSAPALLRQFTFQGARSTLSCGWCDRTGEILDGIYDDGEWMCGDCVSRYAT